MKFHNINIRWLLYASRMMFCRCFKALTSTRRVYFRLSRSDFGKWRHVWKMDATNPDNRDLYVFAEKKTKKALLAS